MASLPCLTTRRNEAGTHCGTNRIRMSRNNEMKEKDKQSKDKSLKDQNTASLVTILIVNIAIFAVALKTDQLVAADYQEILKQWQALIPAEVESRAVSDQAKRAKCPVVQAL